MPIGEYDQHSHKNIIGIIQATVTIAFLLVSCSQLREPRIMPDISNLRIIIGEEGLYRITLSELADVGLDINQINLNSLNLSLKGNPVALLVQDDALLFYGKPPSGRYSRNEAFILSVNEPGKHMSIVSGATNTNGPKAIITKTIHFEENTLYDGRAAPSQLDALGISDPWFWLTIQAQDSAEVSFEIASQIPTSAQIRLAIWGVTSNDLGSPDHNFDLYLNDQLIGRPMWDGETYHIVDVEIPAGALHQGTNTLRMDNRNSDQNPIDIMRLDWIEIVYSGSQSSDSGRAVITSPGNLNVSGIKGNQLIFDVSDPDIPTLLADTENQPDLESILINRPSELFVVPKSDIKKPLFVSPTADSDIRSTTAQADFIIISSAELAVDLDRLVKYRTSQGLSVKVVTIWEVADEFGFGDFDPDAITSFVKYAIANWPDPKPRYLLLVGDASYDYKNYLGNTLASFIPAPMVPVRFGGETVSDARLADADQDKLPDLAVGRWPVRNSNELERLIDRTIAYERGEMVESALFISDDSSSEFSAINDELIKAGNFAAGSALNLTGPEFDELASSWSNGAWLVSYVGHGSLDRWGQNSVLSTQNIGRLRTDFIPPISLQLTCLTGLFSHPDQASLSEQMLFHKSGPVILISATSLTLSSSQQPFGLELIKQLQDPEVLRIGDAMHNAKLNLELEDDSLQEIVDTFSLFADPTTMIRRPIGKN